jgi:hypothetical protein
MNLTFSYKLFYLCLLVLNFMLAGSLSCQTCSGCSKTYTSNTSADISVNTGDVICISTSVNCSGHIFMNGGTLCNHGRITQLILDGGSGIINNSGDIVDMETDVALSDSLTVNSYPGSKLRFTNAVYFSMPDLTSIAFTQYNGAEVSFDDELNINSENVVINNGVTWPDDPSITDAAYFNAVTGNFNVTALTVSNTVTGIINFGSSLNLIGADTGSITNEGTINIYDSFKIVPELFIAITNHAAIYIDNLLQIYGSDTSVVLINDGTSETLTNILSVGDLYFDISGGTITNSYSLFEIVNDLTLSAGSFVNNSLLSVGGTIYDDGSDGYCTLTNNALLNATDMEVDAGCVLNAYGIRSWQEA